MGYAPPGTNPLELIALAQEAERLGYDSAWAAEAWGTDAVTVLSWLAATTSTIKIGSAIMQIPGRTPANTAMTAATLDLMSGGRFLLGLGTSGPQVVEGWHGQPWGKPITKTREYVQIVRAALRRETLEFHGDAYDVPYSGDDATGLGKPLKLLVRPLREAIPIYLAALSPRNVRTAFEDARDDAAVRGVILTGAGDKAFITGADINEFTQGTAVEAQKVRALRTRCVGADKEVRLR